MMIGILLGVAMVVFFGVVMHYIAIDGISTLLAVGGDGLEWFAVSLAGVAAIVVDIGLIVLVIKLCI